MRGKILVALLFAALLISGCARRQTQTGAPTTEKKWRVGVTLLTKQHPFYQELEAAMRETAEKEGIELLIQSAEFNLADQTAQVENFLTSGVDALIICPVDSAGIAGAVKKANAAKVPVFTADIAAQGGDVVCHVASDNVQGGRLAGEYLAKLLGGKGKVVIIDHPVVTSVQDRTRGFMEAISKYPGIQVVDRPPGDGVRDKAMAVTETMLQKHPDLAGIFAINDSTALGALKAVESMGRTNVVIVGYDGDDSLSGGAGNDTIDGGTENDFIVGGEGNDRIIGGSGADELRGDFGNDTIDGGAGNDSISGDDYYGDAEGDDQLFGGDGGDSIGGGGGNDRLDGGNGDDFLRGDEGNDLLIGGAGRDTYAYRHWGYQGDGVDVIQQFVRGEDLLRIEAERSREQLFDDLDSNNDNRITNADALATLSGGALRLDIGGLFDSWSKPGSVSVGGVTVLTLADLASTGWW